jgi:hypothetical protein
VQFVDCIAEDNSVDGFVTTDGSHDITFLRCISRRNGDKTTTSAGDGFSSHVADYNIYYIFCVADSNICSGYALVGTSSGRVINSTAYNNGGDWSVEGGSNLDQVRGGLYIATTGNNPTSGMSWTVRNHIGSQNYPVEVYLTAANKDLVDFDYNCYFEQVSGQFATLDSLSSMISWATYHATYEAHSIHSDPLLISASSLRLQATSPCINSGINQFVNGDGDQYDADGYMVYHSALNQPVYHWLDGVDIGAYAFGGSNKVYHSFSGPNAWPPFPELYDEIGLDNAVYNADGTSVVFDTPTLALAAMASLADDTYLFGGTKGAALYSVDMSAKAEKIKKILADTD